MNSWKGQTFARRKQTVKENPFLQKFEEVIEQGGVGLVSSDESEYEDGTSGPIRYVVRPPRWRALEWTAFWQIVDAVSAMMKRAFGSTRGALPRVRDHLGNTFSKSLKFVHGLPYNLYNQEWLLRASNAGLHVQPGPTHFELSHHPNILS